MDRKNKVWLIVLIMLLIAAIAAVFGFTLDLGELGNRLMDVVEAVFLVLSIVGIVVDPTTKGVGDSQRALGYDKPAE